MIQNDVCFDSKKMYTTKYVLMRFTVQQTDNFLLKWKNQHFGIQSAHTNIRVNESEGERESEV